MSTVVAVFVQLAAGLVTLAFASPPVGVGALVLWMVGRSSARRFGVKAGFGGEALLPLVFLVWLWKNRRDAREMMFCAAVVGGATLLTWAVIKSPAFTPRTFVVVLAVIVIGAGVWAFDYLDGANPTPSNFRAARAQSLRHWDVERTVAAVTDESVKVTDVRAEGDAVVATVTAAPGQSPTDLQGHLMELLAPTTHRLTGLHAVSVTVSHTPTAGVFNVRVGTGHPLREVVRWQDL